ncbi:hypothetical protein I0C86_41695 [Plantactinospora sp. S1510]|uniref:Uncharacterized protein n=1 Tax=Plantactinospora alkalitolerans TaxID=2789879 RepID=A0ABS0HAZ0_9ACTN|nr:hypothetical protein [Plantactinospora alkalitolerans]MBF9135368.1 hypothetical protein [Plantactinospora alkalitolerans]
MTDEYDDGWFALVGRGSHWRVAVRQDAPDSARGEWYELLGRPTETLSWGDLRNANSFSSPPEPVVPLYLTEQAVELLLLPVLMEEYRRQRAEAAASASAPTGRQLSQAALGVRTAIERFAERYSLPAPDWGEPADPPPPPGFLAEITQPMAPIVPAEPIEPVTSTEPVEPVEIIPPEAAAETKVRRLLRSVWPTNNGTQPRGGRHRHHRRDANSGTWPQQTAAAGDDTGQVAVT